MKEPGAGALGPRLGLALAATVAALALCELFARLFLPWSPPSMIRFGELRVVAEGAGIAGQVDTVFERDPEVFWRLRPNSSLPPGGPLFGTIANRQGLRELREIAEVKPDREIRILFLGDSTTFGWGLAADQTQALLTEAALRKRFPDTSVLCINAGVPGYTLFQGWKVLATRGLGFEPDLVVASFGFNDQETWGGRGDLEVYEHLRRAEPPASLAWSRVARLFQTALFPLPEVGSPKRARLTPVEFRELLVKLRETTSEAEIDLLLLVGGLRINVDGSHPPSHRSDYQREQYRFATSHAFGPRGRDAQLDAVPLMQRLAASHRTQEIFLDHVHPTLLANRVVADALAERIAPWLQTRLRY